VFPLGGLTPVCSHRLPRGQTPNGTTGVSPLGPEQGRVSRKTGKAFIIGS
jgi:hypothetical protein